MKYFTKKIWTKEEIQYLKEKYLNTYAKDIGKGLNRTAGAIRVKAFKLKLKSNLKCKGTLGKKGKDSTNWKGGISRDKNYFKNYYKRNYFKDCYVKRK